MMQVWVTKRKAKEFGCSHSALFMGIIPGFYNPDESLWVSRSDILNPIEDMLSFIWAIWCDIRGTEPMFMIAVRDEI
jgi:hypothetical protein